MTNIFFPAYFFNPPTLPSLVTTFSIISSTLSISNWLGHEKIETTMNYIRYSEQYYKQAPYDWIKRVLKFHENVEEENTLKSRYGHFTSVSSGNSPRELSGPGRI